MPIKEYKIVKLRFTAPLHLSIGNGEFDRSEVILHSDKLKSAIATCAFLLNPNWSQEKKKSFFDSVIVSSAFPFLGENLFVPKPKYGFMGILKDTSNQNTRNGLGESDRKKTKRVKFLDIRFFEKLINNQFANSTGISSDLLKRIDQEDNESNFVITEDKSLTETLFKTQVILRTSVLRDTGGGDDEDDNLENRRLYYQERVFFNSNGGLYFFFEMINEDQSEEFEEAFRNSLLLLGDEGIGTDRSTGNGSFDFQLNNDITTIQLELPDDPKKKISLSLFCPEKNEKFEELLEGSSFQYKKRGGYISSPMYDNYLTYRRKSVFMFTEGSVFSNLSELKGHVLDLKPNILGQDSHPIWRDGRGFFIPCF